MPYRASAKGASERDELILKEGDRAIDLFVDLITALRLCHEGKITVGPLISSSVNHESEWSIGGSTHWTTISKKDFFHQDPKYVLHQSDVAKVKELVSNLARLRKVKKLDAIDIALRRFHSSYHGDIYDRLVDQMIAFESLYIGDNKELGYKLALRTAFLLGKGKKQIFTDIKKAYAVRGQIVHGNKQVERSKLEEVIPKSEEYLRQSIRKFLLLLSQGKTLKEIREKLLDENIIKNGRLLA